jgi:hypothetical protein
MIFVFSKMIRAGYFPNKNADWQQIAPAASQQSIQD